MVYNHKPDTGNANIYVICYTHIDLLGVGVVRAHILIESIDHFSINLLLITIEVFVLALPRATSLKSCNVAVKLQMLDTKLCTAMLKLGTVLDTK
jgi:hypothetical protein